MFIRVFKYTLIQWNDTRACTRWPRANLHCWYQLDQIQTLWILSLLSTPAHRNAPHPHSPPPPPSLGQYPLPVLITRAPVVQKQDTVESVYHRLRMFLACDLWKQLFTYVCLPVCVCVCVQVCACYKSRTNSSCRPYLAIRCIDRRTVSSSSVPEPKIIQLNQTVVEFCHA